MLAGGTGFMGAYLKNRFLQDGAEVLVVSRSGGDLGWSPTALQEALEGATLLINLAGRSVNCRPTARNIQEILDSRVRSTNLLGDALKHCVHPPPLWINASGASVYDTPNAEPWTEQGKMGNTAMATIVKKWEAAFFLFQLPQTRKVAFRFSLVLGPRGGILKPYRGLVRWGLGGSQAGGRQAMSWVHVEDVYRIIRFVQDHAGIEGPLNIASPEPVSNRAFMKAMRQVSGARMGLPAPRWVIQLGARIIGADSSLALTSLKVQPKALMDAGYAFRWPALEPALDNIYRS